MPEILNSTDLLTYALLAGPVVSILAFAVRWLVQKFGYEMGRNLTLVMVFSVCVVGAALVRYVPDSFWQEIIALFTVAIAFYQVVIKNILSAVDSYKQDM